MTANKTRFCFRRIPKCWKVKSGRPESAGGFQQMKMCVSVQRGRVCVHRQQSRKIARFVCCWPRALIVRCQAAATCLTCFWRVDAVLTWIHLGGAKFKNFQSPQNVGLWGWDEMNRNFWIASTPSFSGQREMTKKKMKWKHTKKKETPCSASPWRHGRHV